jgi:hypothetical protein
MNDQLIPRLPRKKKQPTANEFRAQLAAAADTIASLRMEIERLQRNPCVRMAAFLRSLSSTDKTTGESTL